MQRSDLWTYSIGDAMMVIERDMADVIVAGGAEACIEPLAIAGFSRLRALSTRYNTEPHLASRPFDAGRDGFVLGEGAGGLFLEERELAKARGAKIYAEIVGYGMSGDAHHISGPSEDGDGPARVMLAAIADAGINGIGHIGFNRLAMPGNVPPAALTMMMAGGVMHQSTLKSESADSRQTLTLKNNICLVCKSQFNCRGVAKDRNEVKGK